MEELPGHAQKILGVAKRRTAAILERLAEGDVDEALELLRLRAAALHNFKAIDAKAQKVGLDLMEDPRIRQLGIELQEIEPQLMRALAEARDQTERQLARVSEVRSAIGRFHSGHSPKSRFNRAV